LSEAKYGKLWRGLGELTVITVGVLLALAADGWRQDREDQASEFQYLERLQADLVSDSVTLAQGLEVYRSKQTALPQLIEASSSPGTLSPGDIGDRLASVTEWSWAGLPRANSDTFDEMVSSGQLGLIRDATLRSELSQYYRLYENSRFGIETRRTRLAPFSYELVRRPAWSRTTGTTDFKAAELSDEELAVLASPQLLADLRRLLTAELNQASFASERLDGLQQLAQRLRLHLGEASGR
jgi:hypothetical protein